MKRDLPYSVAINGLLIAVALLGIWALHGTLPGFAMPTLGQAIWTSGFALSFADSCPPGLMATHFGGPLPAPIAFGLAGAYPEALLICAGLHPADAYSAMAAFWLALAFLAAWRLARRFVKDIVLPIAGAVVWMTLPVIWGHAGYSMLALGIALLPFYFLAALYLIDARDWSAARRAGVAAFYFVACLIAVFMDGYSFMMFATGSSVLLLAAFLCRPADWRYFIFVAGPVHVGSFAAAYVLYVSYVGKTQFEPSSLNFFRAWGADIIYFLLPTKGLLWLGDFLGFSQERRQSQLFGDASVWTTTFVLPLVLAGVAAWWGARREKSWLVTAFLIVALAGLYLSLGLSFKFDAVRAPDAMSAASMPATAAVGSTGTEALSLRVPGFRNMRASYRWVALACFGFWVLTMVLLGTLVERRRFGLASLIVALLIAFNLPPLSPVWRAHAENRQDFMAIDAQLIADLRTSLRPGERVAFLPFGNDMFVNYLAPSAGIRSYNIGGDKNLSQAQENWPETMREFSQGVIDDDFAARTLRMLARREADAIVFPYIDLLWAAHEWPPTDTSRDEMVPVLRDLDSTHLVDIEDRDTYAVVRLRPEYRGASQELMLEQRIGASLCMPPQCVRRKGFGPGVLHVVGSLRDGVLQTDGRAGFLHFGPYISIEPGVYDLTLFGKAVVPSGAWVDVATDKGAHVLGTFPLAGVEPAGNVLLTRRIVVDKAAPDLEIRLWVDAAADVAVSGYSLRKID